MKVLLVFNSTKKYIASVKRLAQRLDFKVIEVRPSDFGQPLGYLAKIDGFDRKKGTGSVPSFTAQMIVLSGFDSDSVDEFLAEYKASNIEPVGLKASITPTNIFWDAGQLYAELAREHAEMNGLTN